MVTIVLKNWLLRVFGLSNIIVEQAVTIDRLQMQCDLYEQMAIIDADIIRKLAGVDERC